MWIFLDFQNLFMYLFVNWSIYSEIENESKLYFRYIVLLFYLRNPIL